MEAGTTDEVTIYLQDKKNPTGYSQVLEEKTTPSGTPTRSYILGHDVIAQADGSIARHFLYDGGGSTRALLDATGQVVTNQVFAYDAFGNRIEDPANPITPATSLLYRGQYFDVLLKQYQLRDRYYNPSTGRLTSLDSFEAGSRDVLSLHKYLYSNGNPVGLMDPSGRSALTDIALGSVLSGVVGATLTATYGYAKGWSGREIARASGIAFGVGFLAVWATAGIALALTAGASGASLYVGMTAVGLMIMPTTLGLAIGNFKAAMQGDDPVDKWFATIDLALAVWGAFGMKSSLSGVAAQERAMSDALAYRLAVMRQGAREGAVTVIRQGGNDPFVIRATSKNAGGPISPEIAEFYEGLMQMKKVTCGEPRALAELQKWGKDPRGAWAATVLVADGTPLPACDKRYCNVLLRKFGINDAVNPEIEGPLFLLLDALLPNLEDIATSMEQSN